MRVGVKGAGINIKVEERIGSRVERFRVGEAFPTTP